MKTFHHGGRLGDLILSLYTVKALGGGKLFISERQSPSWSFQMAQELTPFLLYQDYIENVEFVYEKNIDKIDEIAKTFNYDLVDGERTVWSQENFPEWIGPDWPGNIHIAKRYAVAFNISWNLDLPWLNAPKDKEVDIVFHAPHRRLVRNPQSWVNILNQLNEYKVIIIDHDYQWNIFDNVEVLKPNNYLETASYINSAKLFVGVSSSCGACAEGLGKKRFIELCAGAETLHPSLNITYMSDDEIINEIQKLMKGNI